ncbi:MAG: 6-bladed beta-propeller [Candidatus Aegiribacteria sp.]|nr:6-bladed beta-propeller [Candidatus Aegiribacteria sp.]
MKKLLTLTFLILLIACGAQESPSEEVFDESITTTEEYVLPDADVYMTITDSIGIELGDSNYVFGAVAGVDFTPEGDIAVLDVQKSCISLFSPEGEFIERIGRQGSGPGEFQYPQGMAFFPDGGLVVSDAMGGKLVYFNSDLEYESDLAGFYPAPPAALLGLEGGVVIGMKPDFDQNEEGMFMGFTIARWEKEQAEPTVIYHSSMSPFDPADLTAMLDDILNFGVAPEGIVFTASMSTEVYEFTVWNSEGEEISIITIDDFERVAKNQEEIDTETEVVNRMMIQQGMPPAMANWEPDPYRQAIVGFGVDGQGRLWVRKGTAETLYFDVYSVDGLEFLFTAALDVGEIASMWTVVIKNNKFIAFDSDPELYPQVFIGDLSE